jgi:hypothetical protein
MTFCFKRFLRLLTRPLFLDASRVPLLLGAMGRFFGNLALLKRFLLRHDGALTHGVSQHTADHPRVNSTLAIKPDERLDLFARLTHFLDDSPASAAIPAYLGEGPGLTVTCSSGSASIFASTPFKYLSKKASVSLLTAGSRKPAPP